MYYRDVLRVLGSYLVYLALALCCPLAVAAYFQYLAPPYKHPQPHSTGAFLLTIFVCLLMAWGFRWIGRKAKGRLYRREGLVLVVVIWFITASVGALPFLFSGTFEKPVDAYFEAMSGLTTTGASVMHPKAYDANTGREVAITNTLVRPYNVTYTFYGTVKPVVDRNSGEILYTGIEAVSKGVLFWRSFMQWLGGMGIVVLFVAVLPALGVGGRTLFQAEVPGPSKEAITPRVKETASILWKLYLGVTLAEVVLLCLTNKDMGLFDATTITFSNLSTGGFSVRNASIGSYQNVNTEWVVMLFMLVGSINFALYFHCLRGKFYRIYEPEFLIYIICLAAGMLFISWRLIGTEKILLMGQNVGQDGSFSTSEAFRYGAFQLLSAQSSTGFTTANFDMWPCANQALLLIVMFVGSMSGSTGGGIKIVRHYMAFKICQNKIESLFAPERVRSFRIGNFEVNAHAAIMVLCFYLIVAFLTVLGTFLLSLDHVDLETALSINACMLNNIGIAFRAAGPTGSFAFLSPFAKILSTFWMVLGRLEFFAVLVVLIPRFWKEA